VTEKSKIALTFVELETTFTLYSISFASIRVIEVKAILQFGQFIL